MKNLRMNNSALSAQMYYRRIMNEALFVSWRNFKKNTAGKERMIEKRGRGGGRKKEEEEE